MRRTLSALLLLLVAGAGVLAWLAVDATRGRAALSADRPELRALAAPGTVALVSVDVAGIVGLEEGLFGVAAGPLRPEGATEESGLLARLRRRGFDPRAAVDRVVAAARLVPRAGGGEPALRLAAVATGRFQPARLERALAEDPALAVERAESRGTPVLEVERLDPDDCEPGRRWHVAIGAERIALAEAGDLPWLLERLEARAPEGPELAALPAPLGSPLLAGALFVEEARRAAEAHPLARAGVERAGEGLEAIHAMAFAVGASAFPPRAVLAAGIESADAAGAEARAARWREALRRSRASWEDRLGTLASLHDALAVTASGRVVRLRTRIDGETLRRIGRVPSEILALALGSPGGGAAAEGGDGAEVRYEDEPTPYEARTAASALPAYDDAQPFAEPADATAGPFGVWIDAARSVEGDAVEDAPPAPGERLPALDLEAAGTGIPNLGPASGASGLGATRARLRVTAVRSARGEDLLREERCGEARNGADAPFEATPVGGGAALLRAKKTLRLAPGTRLDEVAAVEGEIALHLPVRVERRRLPAREGEALEAAGLRLELTRVRERALSYRLSGETEHLLELRGLAADGRALERGGSSRVGAFLGPGRSGTVRFHGPVDALEAVIAAEEERVLRRFALRGGRPTPTGEAPPGAGRPRAPRSADALLGRDPPAAPGGDSARAEALAGPFRLRVTRVWGLRRLRPQLAIDAPEASLLRASASAAELRLERATLADGSSHSLALRRYASFDELFGREGLRATLRPALPIDAEGGAELAGLRGALVLRVPLRTRALALDAEPGARAAAAGLEARLERIGREGVRLALVGGAGRLVAVRAFDRAGRALAVPEIALGSDAEPEPGAGATVEVGVAGAPARLELEVAEALREHALPFALRLEEEPAGRGPARAAAGR